MIMKTNEGLIMNIVVGIIGAIIGGWLMSFFGSTGITGFNLYSFVVAVLGAIVLTYIVRAFQRSS